MVGWTTFGFAGVYPSTLRVPGVVCLLLAAVFRPWSRERSHVPSLQVWLAVFLAATAAQLLPLPSRLLDVISPSARTALSQLALVMPCLLYTSDAADE